MGEKKRKQRKEIESEFKDQVYLDFKILQSMMDVTSVLLLQVSQGTTHISKAKHGLEGWRPPLGFCLLPSLCNESHKEGSFRVCDLFRGHWGLLGGWFAFDTATRY